MMNRHSFYWMVFLILLVKINANLVLEEHITSTILYYTDNKNQSIRVQPIYNKSLDIVQFKISCSDCEEDDYDCIINVSRKTNSCIDGIPMDHGTDNLVFSLNSPLLVIPEDKDALIPYPGCSYLFNNMQTFENNCNITGEIRISDCVNSADSMEDITCNCNKFQFKFRNLTTELDGNILTLIAQADFEDDLNVTSVKYALYCNYEWSDDIISPNYNEIIFNVTLKEYYDQMCQIEFKYINRHNCSDAYSFMSFILPNNTGFMPGTVSTMQQKSSTTFMVFCLLLLIVIVGMFYIAINNKRNIAASTEIAETYVTQQTFRNELYTANGQTMYDNDYFGQYEYNHEEIRITECVGEGEFGNVYLAKCERLYKEYGRIYSYIAVKKLKGNANEQTKMDFLQEIDLMTKITDFRHVVRILGYCTKIPPYMLITEFLCCGDLKAYLIELREEWKKKTSCKLLYYKGEYLDTNASDNESPDTPTSTNSDCQSGITKYTDLSQQSPLLENQEKFQYQLKPALDSNELQNFALQIAKGMAHLETIPIIHKDLAARNVLLNECRNLKISDFGLSSVGDNNAVLKEAQKVPVRWTAIDVFINRMYNIKSDVWSFAVVLWEIGMLGACPYQDIDNADLMMYLRDDNNRLERPPICSEALYELMLRCWSRDFNLRPSFHHVVDLLDKKQRIYETFDFVNPTYIFPPTEEMNAKESL